MDVIIGRLQAGAGQDRLQSLLEEHNLKPHATLRTRLAVFAAVFVAVLTAVAAVWAVAGLGSTTVLAQEPRVLSPAGSSATQVGGIHDERQGYVGGAWIDITYGRPLKRGRDLFGPSDYPEFLSDGADVWRAGANVSTQLKNAVPIVIAGKTIAPGTYTVFIDLNVKDRWTLIISNWPAQTTYDEKNTTAVFGAYGYTPEKDVVRVPMQVELLPHSFDQLSWQFLDVTDRGGRLALVWDQKLASVPFTVQR